MKVAWEKRDSPLEVESCTQVLDILKVEPRIADTLDVGYGRKSRVKDNQRGFEPEQFKICSSPSQRREKYLEQHVCVGGRSLAGL